MTPQTGMSPAQPNFANRREAGQVLAQRLAHHRGAPGLLVLALPRGGVAVGYEVAAALEADLDVFIVRKLGMPGREEYAIGAIASGGVQVQNPMPAGLVSAADLAAVVAREQAELQRREKMYRGERPPLALEGRHVIVVDDGLATGATMRAALRALRQRNPARLVAAAPVGAADTCAALAAEADEVVCAATPEPFRAVGLWYRDFPQASDEEVRRLLAQAQANQTTT